MSQEKTDHPKNAPEVVRRIVDAQGEIDRLNATIAGMETTVQEQFDGRTRDWDEIKRLNAVIERKDAHIEEMRKYNKRIEAESWKRTLRQKSTPKDRALAELKRKIQDQEFRIHEDAELIKNQEKEISEQVSKISGLTAGFKIQENNVGKAHHEVERLRSALESSRAELKEILHGKGEGAERIAFSAILGIDAALKGG